ncbi:MAG: hypothetical protein GF315_06385 [candidate division Zixibacteria bacterium]|nr:hypothetical protein [candidate division Zixibacteria bacterium]
MKILKSKINMAITAAIFISCALIWQAVYPESVEHDNRDMVVNGNAIANDIGVNAQNSGFSFANSQVVDYNDSKCDIYFEYDRKSNTWYLHNGRDLTDIQDAGYIEDLNYVSAAPNNGWFSYGYMEIASGHVYFIWTADDHYAALRISNIPDERNEGIEFDWRYQTIESCRWFIPVTDETGTCFINDEYEYF